MGAFHSMTMLLFVLILIGLPIGIVILLSKKDKDGVANTWKFSTVISVIFAFVTGFFIITFPIFLYLAYRSYKAGRPVDSVQGIANQPLVSVPATGPFGGAAGQTSSAASEIAELHRLLQQGALTQEEFDQEKRKLLAK